MVELVFSLAAGALGANLAAGAFPAMERGLFVNSLVGCIGGLVMIALVSGVTGIALASGALEPAAMFVQAGVGILGGVSVLASLEAARVRFAL